MKLTNVVRAPPNRSASHPPTGLISDPISGPRNVMYATFTASTLWPILTGAAAAVVDGL